MKALEPDWIAFLITAALLGVSACNSSDSGSDGADKRVMAPSTTSTTMYDPNVNVSPGDNRPTAPSTNAITPDEMNADGNSGIVIPAGGKR